MAQKTVESTGKSPKKVEKSGVQDLIVYAFGLRNEKPDASHFGRWSVALNAFIKPQDENLRSYTAEQIKYVITYLHNKGVFVEVEHFYYAGLISSIVDDRLGVAQDIINQILKKQEKPIAVNIPSGW